MSDLKTIDRDERIAVDLLRVLLDHAPTKTLPENSLKLFASCKAALKA